MKTRWMRWLGLLGLFGFAALVLVLAQRPPERLGDLSGVPLRLGALDFAKFDTADGKWSARGLKITREGKITGEISVTYKNQQVTTNFQDFLVIILEVHTIFKPRMERGYTVPGRIIVVKARSSTSSGAVFYILDRLDVPKDLAKNPSPTESLEFTQASLYAVRVTRPGGVGLAEVPASLLYPKGYDGGVIPLDTELDLEGDFIAGAAGHIFYDGSIDRLIKPFVSLPEPTPLPTRDLTRFPYPAPATLTPFMGYP